GNGLLPTRKAGLQVFVRQRSRGRGAELESDTKRTLSWLRSPMPDLAPVRRKLVSILANDDLNPATNSLYYILLRNNDQGIRKGASVQTSDCLAPRLPCLLAQSQTLN